MKTPTPRTDGAEFDALENQPQDGWRKTVKRLADKSREIEVECEELRQQLMVKNPAAVALGKIKSAKKAKTSAVNGALGGRPKTRYVVEQHGSVCYIHDALLGKRLIGRPVAQLSSLWIIAKNLNDSARRPNNALSKSHEI